MNDREYRGTLTRRAPAPFRDRSVERNLALFEKMRTGGFEEGKTCLRAKIDMASPFYRDARSGAVSH